MDYLARRLAVGSTLALGTLAPGCHGDGTAPAPPALTAAHTPSFSISDAAHTSATVLANPNFFFLPPTVPTWPTFGGKFDRYVSPALSICALNGSACQTPLVAEFTRTGGPGGERIRLGDSDYSVYWYTRRFTLNPSGVYRIRVLVAGTELGHADVQFGDAEQLKAVDREKFIPLEPGATLRIRFRVEKGAVFVVGADGGTWTGAAGGRVTLLIPAGALSRTVGVTAIPARLDPADDRIIGTSVYAIGPSGTELRVPLTLTIRYSASQVPSGVDESMGRLYEVVDGAWTEVAGSVADVASHAVTGRVTRFGTYSVKFPPPSESPPSEEPPPPASAGPTVGECAQPRAEWIWCDDFEADRLSSYFEYVNPGGRFTREPGFGVGGSIGLRARFSKGTIDAGNIKLAFGRTPSSSFRAVDGGTADHRDVYWRIWARTQPGWSPSPDTKLSRAIVFAGANWSQAAIGHIWSDESNGHRLLIDPASGTDAAGALRTTKYNDFANLRWLGIAASTTPVFGPTESGKWHCIEGRMKLNDAGEANGVFQIWINGALEAERTGLNWVGSYKVYGINAVFIENWINGGSAAEQERSFDGFIVSSGPIGC